MRSGRPRRSSAASGRPPTPGGSPRSTSPSRPRPTCWPGGRMIRCRAGRSPSAGTAARTRPYEAVADLTAGRVESWTPVPGVTPNVTDRRVPRRRRGAARAPGGARRGGPPRHHRPGLVLFDVWTYGAAVMPEQWRDRRLGWCDVWLRATPTGNPYAHPVSGLKIIVDLNSLEVLQIEDHHDHGLPEVVGGVRPRRARPRPGSAAQAADDPPARGTLVHPRRPPADLAELVAADRLQRPRGAGAAPGPVRRLRRDARHRVPAVLRRDGGALPRPRLRPLPADGVRHRRVGARGDDHARSSWAATAWARSSTSTRWSPTAAGEPLLIPQAICLHEEDAGVLWKHVDPITGAQSRRMRRMVISFHATVANYEYLVYWRFYADGNIECEVRATGIMVTTPLATDGDRSPYGATVDRRTYAPVPPALHRRPARPGRRRRRQHRGPAGRRRAADQSGQPVRTGHDRTGATVIGSEAESARDASWATQRTWSVTNPDRTNAHGDPVAYKIIPTAAIPTLLDPASPVYQRAPVIGHTLWVTAYDDAERWPAGDYPTQSRPGHRDHRVDRGGRAAGRRRRGALVRLRHPPHHPARGLAGDARGHRLVLAEAVRLLRPQPGAGPGPVTRYGPMYGPDVTFLGVAALRPRRPDDVRRRRRGHPRRALRRRHLAPAGTPVRAAGDPDDRLPAAGRVAALAGPAHRRAGRPAGLRRRGRGDVRRRHRAVAGRAGGRRRAGGAAPGRSRCRWAATTRSPSRTRRAAPTCSGPVGSR